MFASFVVVGVSSQVKIIAEISLFIPSSALPRRRLVMDGRYADPIMTFSGPLVLVVFNFTIKFLEHKLLSCSIFIPLKMIICVLKVLLLINSPRIHPKPLLTQGSHKNVGRYPWRTL